MPINYKDLLLKEVKELFKKLPPNVRIRVYYDDMGKSKYTLNELGSRVDKLELRMNRIESKLDQIGDALFEFIKTTNARFDSLEKDVKDINARLDYIVQANNLKDLPRNKK
ncbi:MAG: hypothetical protein MJ214_02090 [Bacilli bacterium]|nr:hypothetical protein [Bacilli bacterium]